MGFVILRPSLPATHQPIVSHALRELMARNDVVVLAQASMARVANAIPTDEHKVPILSSPRLAVEALAVVLAKLKNSPLPDRDQIHPFQISAFILNKESTHARALFHPHCQTDPH